MKKWFQSHEKLTIFLALFSAVVIYAGFNIWQSGRWSIWFDESFSAFMIRHNFAEIWHYTSLDVNSPLYYFLLKLWSMLFGHDVAMLRSFSILCGLGVIIVGFFLSRKLFGAKTAWFALPLLTLSPMLVRYGTEMRTYTLTTLLIFGATLALVIAAKKNQRKVWIIYGILAALAMWSHYYAALPLAAGFIWFMTTRWQKDIKVRANLLKVFDKNVKWALGLAFVLFLPWLGVMLWQVAVVQGMGFWIPPVSFMTLGNFFGEMLVYLGVNGLKSWWLLCVLIWLILAIFLSVKLWQSNKKSRRNYLLILLIVLVPPLTVAVISMPPLQSMFINRYVIYSMIFVSILVAFLASADLKKLKKVRIVFYVLTLILSILGVYNVATYGNFNRDTNSMSVAKTIMVEVATNLSERTIVIADNPWIFYDAVNYATDKNPVYFLDSSTEYEFGSLAMLRDDKIHKIKDLAKFVKSGQTVWFISGSSNAKNPPIETWETLRKIEVPFPIGDAKPAWAVEYLVR
ncbi:glycosyltransferase family 39 protein [Candidatus Saccharibacteria bacterium]|nr:glycosyltransferase family 39 protein [Candidatus Saccharibacteria bacterium]